MQKNKEHLWAFAISLSLLAIIIVWVHFTAYSDASQVLYKLPNNNLDIKKNGNIFSKVSLRDPKILTAYGASEMYNEASAYRSTDFFSDFHAGFYVFNMAFSGAPSLIEAETLGALGKELNGKKVVISFTPKQFFVAQNPYDYENLFSDLHSRELLYSDYLSLETKRLSADRALDYIKVSEKYPFIAMTAKLLLSDKPESKYFLKAITPVEKLVLWVNNRQDEYRTIQFTHDQLSKPVKGLDEKVLAITKLSQADLMASAIHKQKDDTDNNRFGVKNDYALKHPGSITQAIQGSKDAEFEFILKNSKERKDFKLLLSILKDLNAKPLLLGRPIKEQYYNNMGLSTPAQEKYYAQLNALIAPYGFDYVDFKDQSKNLYFGTDIAPHTGAVGWVYINQVLEKFYHE